MLTNLFIFAVALYLLVKGATMATKHAARLAESFGLSKYTVGFIIVAVISVLPEMSIAINSAIDGVPSFGLGTLLAAAGADLTLIFAVIILFSGRSLKVESSILKNQAIFPFLLLLPLILGFDGFFSRRDGAALIIVGAAFYYMALRKGMGSVVPAAEGVSRPKSAFFLIFSMIVLLTGANYTVNSATSIASSIGISPILIGMLIVGLGATLPELFFALKSVKKKDDSLAIGDLLGTVLADTTIIVGLLAMIVPFSFPKNIIYVSGGFIVVAAFVLFHFMRTGRRISKKEAFILIAFWLIFVSAEFIVNK